LGSFDVSGCQDLVFDVEETLVKIQVKYAWFDEPSLNYIENLDLFYIFPIDIFIGYGSEIHLVEIENRQRKPRSTEYRNAWELISQASVGKESCF
jgi:PD-(D/E)XK endonuclease